MSAITAVHDAILAAITEIDAQLAQTAPQLEGLRDYQRLNIQDGTRREIEAAIGDYDRRVGLLHAAKSMYQTSLDNMTAADKALADDGAPTLPERQISAAAIADLDAQLSTMGAARGLFVAQATTLGLTAGDPRPKAAG
jgi:TolA-binding protein